MSNTMPLSTKARELARQVGRLRPDWRDPERYFEERDQLHRTALALAKALEREERH